MNQKEKLTQLRQHEFEEEQARSRKRFPEIEEASHSILYIIGKKTDRSTRGSAVLGYDGNIYTAAHVIKEAKEITIVDKQHNITTQFSTDAYPIHIDPDLDIAMFEAPRTVTQSVTPRPFTVDINPTTYAFLVGFPVVDPRLTIHHDKPTIHVVYPWQDEQTPHMYRTVVRSSFLDGAGSSGGPVLNIHGEILGIITNAIELHRRFALFDPTPLETTLYAVKTENIFSSPALNQS